MRDEAENAEEELAATRNDLLLGKLMDLLPPGAQAIFCITTPIDLVEPDDRMITTVSLKLDDRRAVQVMCERTTALIQQWAQNQTVEGSNVDSENILQ